MSWATFPFGTDSIKGFFNLLLNSQISDTAHENQFSGAISLPSKLQTLQVLSVVWLRRTFLLHQSSSKLCASIADKLHSVARSRVDFFCCMTMERICTSQKATFPPAKKESFLRSLQNNTRKKQVRNSSIVKCSAFGPTGIAARNIFQFHPPRPVSCVDWWSRKRKI